MRGSDCNILDGLNVGGVADNMEVNMLKAEWV
jgi:hypothetical protein